MAVMARSRPRPGTTWRGRQRLEVAKKDGYVVHSDEQEITVRVSGAEPGIRVSVRLGADGQTVYLEVYDWQGRTLRFVSTVTGEAIDTHQPEDRPHPELAIMVDEP